MFYVLIPDLNVHYPNAFLSPMLILKRIMARYHTSTISPTLSRLPILTINSTAHLLHKITCCSPNHHLTALTSSILNLLPIIYSTLACCRSTHPLALISPHYSVYYSPSTQTFTNLPSRMLYKSIGITF